MHFPNLVNKHVAASIIEPEDYVNYMKGRGRLPETAPPQGVIFCYQPSLLSFIKEKHQTRSAGGFLSKLLYLPETQNQVAVIGGFGIGAPVATIYIEV